MKPKLPEKKSRQKTESATVLDQKKVERETNVVGQTDRAMNGLS